MYGLGEPYNLAIRGEPLKVTGRRRVGAATLGLQRLANRLRMWGPAAVWAAVLFLLSAWPDPRGPSWLALNDKVVHFILFGVLGAALGLGRVWSGSSVPHAFVLAVGALYGAADEWHQTFVPNRVPSMGDWYADVAGVFVGYVLVVFLAGRAGRMPGAEQRTG